MDWQPIETAPLDGTEVLAVYVKQYCFEKKLTIYGPWTVLFNSGVWWASHDGVKAVEYMSDFGTEYKEVGIDPTHWMPLPLPPSIKIEEL